MHPGVLAALLAAILFGAGTPFAKMLLANASPWFLAGLLYAGSGCGLWLLRRVRKADPVRLPRNELPWLIGAIVSGGIVAPVFLMWGLAGSTGSSASLLLNAEGVFTALLAWFAFKENFDRRIAFGIVLIVAGAVVLSWPAEGTASLGATWPALAIILACLAWGVDNNFTRKVSLADATWVAMVKGLAAGATNLVLAYAVGATVPSALPALAAMALGFLSYGASLTLFVVALRHLGTAGTGAYFSVAPFIGAAISVVVLGDPVTWTLAAALVLMASGVLLHLTEHHAHRHVHQLTQHEHAHIHGEDVHHRHSHSPPVLDGTRHSHAHVHPHHTHQYEHFPDAHHQHSH